MTDRYRPWIARIGVISDSVVGETAKWVVAYPRAYPIFHVLTLSFWLASGPARIVRGHDVILNFPNMSIRVMSRGERT